MLGNLNKNDKQNLQKNLKLMVMSAIVLFALLIYVLYKSSENIQSSSYYIGLIFLLLLLSISFFLRIYKDRIKKIIPQTKFAKELQQANDNNLQNDNNSSQHSYETLEFVNSNITFKDVAGITHIKEELEEIVDFLNNPKKYLKHGIKLPKGILLVGPPGVGKTLIARAVAGEANVPFLYQSGASFVHIYVGMGAKRVKELFSKAKAHSPAIIFIDEIDAVGKSRSGNSNDEREATLNELLTQMDGFDGESGVIVIAATNKIEVLDEALLRAGRFDRRLFLGLPNVEDRKMILNLYLKNKKIDFSIDELAFNTSGFSSAALATLINEALLNMVKRGANSLNSSDVEIAKNKVEFGKKEKSLLTTKEKEILALYQASKAFISKEEVSLFQDGVKSISANFPSKSDLFMQLKSYLSGSVGVEVVTGESYLVSKNDIVNAYNLASKIVDEYKMAPDTSLLIEQIRSDLKREIYINIDEIERLKELVLKYEAITIDDIKK